MLNNKIKSRLVLMHFVKYTLSTAIDQISKHQSHGLPLVASYMMLQLALKKKKKKFWGFSLLWLIKNNAYFSLRLGSVFCWTGSLFISNLTQRRNGLPASVPDLCSVFKLHSANPRRGIRPWTRLPSAHHIYTHLHKQRNNMAVRELKVNHNNSIS